MIRASATPRSGWVVFAIGFAGCGGGPAPDHPQPSSARAVASNAPPLALSSSAGAAARPPRPAMADPGPVWAWRGPNDGGFKGYTAPIEIDTRMGRCRFARTDADTNTFVECTAKGETGRAWGYDDSGGFVDDATLAADDAFLYVARFSDISSGGMVTAYDLDKGTLAWTTILVALGPVAHSEYWAKVEIAVQANVVRVFGSEAAGRYIEELDARTGATLGNWRVDASGHAGPLQPFPETREPAVLHPGAADGVAFAFPASGVPPLPDKDISVRAGDVHCTLAFDRKSGRTHFACNDPKGARVWGFDLRDQSVASGALASDPTGVYVAELSGIATGTTVTGFDATSGRLRWRRRLFGVGPVAHSKYFNEVSMRTDRATLVVSGWEAAGKYVEVLDTQTGADLGNREER